MKRILLITLLSIISLAASSQNDVDFDINRLSSKLQLTPQQTEYIQVINENLNKDIENAKQSKTKHQQIIKTINAIKKDLKRAKKVLNDEQLEMYSKLLIATIRNNYITHYIY